MIKSLLHYFCGDCEFTTLEEFLFRVVGRLDSVISWIIEDRGKGLETQEEELLAKGLSLIQECNVG